MKQNLNLPFWVHWLVFGAVVTARELRRFLALCKENNVAGVELPWEPLMDISAKQTAELLLESGITHVTLCCFFSEIDPLSKTGRKKALESLERAAQFAAELRGRGITVFGITGPWAFMIAKKYRRLGIHRRLVAFVREVRKIARRFNLPFFLECLRSAENTALWGTVAALRLVRQVNDPEYIRLHLDTFHMSLWEGQGVDDQISYTLMRCGKWLGYFHGSGSRRRTPGTIGCLEGWYHDWQDIAEGLGRNKKHGGRLFCICFEGFSPKFRRLVPAIGGEFPKDLPPEEAIPIARMTFQKVGICDAV